MKKLFTVDDFMVALIAALGYGYGYAVAEGFGWPAPLCLVACFALGMALEGITDKIIFSKTVQKSTKNRIFAYAATVLVFLAAHAISTRLMGVSLLEEAKDEFLSVIGFAILGFVVNLIIRWVRIKRIRSVYGDGNEGYVSEIDDEDVEELNTQNRPVLGEYDAECAVKTRTGTYVGEKNGKTVYYLGIPYAQAPIGELRWKAPEPLPASDAVMEATSFGASAMQAENRGAISGHHRQDEDCLTLNVCTGSEKAEEKRPVLVLFHNSGFAFGGSADPLLYGGNYISAFPDIVFVTFNYRLGVFGFIDFSEVPGGEAYPDAPNLGLLDQIAALKWVKENIAAFGGDPEQITVAGFESGATCICLLAASKQAKGLFKRAFVFNGNLEEAYGTSDAPMTLAKDLLRNTQTTTVEELSRLKPETLIGAAQSIRGNWGMSAPALDGRLVPTDVYRAYKEAAAADIEFIVGVPSNESRVFRSFVGGQGYEDIVALATADMQRRLDGQLAAAVREYIEGQAAASSEIEAQSKFIDQWIALSAYRVAVKLAEGGSKMHLLYWAQKPLIENLGSGTVDVLATLFGNEDALEMYGSVVDAGLSEVLQTLLHKYVIGDALQLYRNEIRGVDALDWEAFPKALIVCDDRCRCGTIEDRLTEIDGLVDHMLR